MLAYMWLIKHLEIKLNTKLQVSLISKQIDPSQKLNPSKLNPSLENGKSMCLLK